jgi:hypothetical protein
VFFSKYFDSLVQRKSKKSKYDSSDIEIFLDSQYNHKRIRIAAMILAWFENNGGE